MDNERNEKGSTLVPFGRVSQRTDRILIVASGPSAEQLDLELVRDARKAGVYVLAVNGAWSWCWKIDGWFTLDPDLKVIQYIRLEKTTVKRYVAVPYDYGQPDAEINYHRDKCFFPGIIYLQRLAGDGRKGSLDGLSTDPHCIHTGNSAYGALGVARHMNPTRIGLIGVDADKRIGYAHREGRPKGYLYHLPALFKSAVQQLEDEGITVQNGSPDSLVKCFERRDPNAVVKWLME